MRSRGEAALNHLLISGLTALGVPVTPDSEITLQLIRYLDLLSKWNRVYNLTAITDPQDMVIKHILDSVSVLSYLRALPGGRILDVGSGAGFPGIPLALMCPERAFTLLDSNHKKTTFLKQVIIELRLKTVEVIQRRVSEFYPQNPYHMIITRAFSTLRDFWVQTEHLDTVSSLDNKTQTGCVRWAMKGLYPKEELAELAAFVSKTSNTAHMAIQVYPLTVPGIHAERHLVEIRRQ
jgi:16S rRNA (guanine527-N7)-methyltransferase